MVALFLLLILAIPTTLIVCLLGLFFQSLPLRLALALCSLPFLPPLIADYQDKTTRLEAPTDPYTYYVHTPKGHTFVCFTDTHGPSCHDKQHPSYGLYFEGIFTRTQETNKGYIYKLTRATIPTEGPEGLPVHSYDLPKHWLLFSKYVSINQLDER